MEERQVVLYPANGTQAVARHPEPDFHAAPPRPRNFLSVRTPPLGLRSLRAALPLAAQARKAQPGQEHLAPNSAPLRHFPGSSGDSWLQVAARQERASGGDSTGPQRPIVWIVRKLLVHGSQGSAVVWRRRVVVSGARLERPGDLGQELDCCGRKGAS
jgi:hypothetical protein